MKIFILFYTFSSQNENLSGKEIKLLGNLTLNVLLIITLKERKWIVFVRDSRITMIKLI